MSNADFLTERIIDDKGPVKSFDVVPVNDFGSFGTVTQMTYTVQSGDTLSKISERFYGKTDYWKNIFEANRALLSARGPNYLERGWKLVIPPISGVPFKSQSSQSVTQVSSVSQVKNQTATQTSSPVIQPNQSFFQRLVQGPNKWLLLASALMVGLIIFKKSRKAEL